MKTNKGSGSNSTSDNLIDLYTRIPDYSDIQHLGQSDFINTLEKLKEEFRQCRASLYNEEFCSDSEYLAGKSSPGFGRSRTTDDFLYYSTKYGKGDGTLTSEGYNNEDGKVSIKINNHNFTTQAECNKEEQAQGQGEVRGRGGQYLSIKSCELHRTPYRTVSASSLNYPTRHINAYGRSSLLEDRGKEEEFREDDNDDDDDDDEDSDDDYNGGERYIPRNDREWSVGSSFSDISISKWSSSPEIYRSGSRSKELLPPSNTEKRSLQRKFRNNSAPSVAFKEEEDEPKKTFKANPVPAHVYKPLYEFIMLKNQRRSERIREQSKRKLLSQMKPFSFCNGTKSSGHTNNTQQGRLNRSMESLNNTKPLKKKRNDLTLNNVKTNNNRLTPTTIFKAKPPPPRTRALLAAIRQKEQQEYRELKKRLRAELLLKNSSLPPSMAAREKRAKITNAKIDEVLRDYQKSFSENRKNRMHRNFRETSTGTDDTGLLTDDDRITDDDYSGATVGTRKITTIVKPFKFSQRTPRKFTSFGTSRHSAAAIGVFEASSNDNHASRLRYEAAKRKEEVQIRREEEEMLRLMKAERRRQKLRDTHLHAWQHACSYSAEQDIAMRRQLRHAASILERETFVRDMSCMLSRVRSAPLLLEGGHRLERKQEPCKKHREELRTSSNRADDRDWNKLSTPRLYSYWGEKRGHGSSNRAAFTYGGDEKSETVALAEGSLSNSDNESCEEEDNNNDRRYNAKQGGSFETDSRTDLEEEQVGNNHADDDDNQEENRVSRENGTDRGKTEHALNTDNEVSDEAEDNETHVDDNDNDAQSREN